MANYTQTLEDLRRSFGTGRTKEYEWRHRQLQQLNKMLDENMEELKDALFKDLHKNRIESYIMEVTIVKGELRTCMDNLKYWMKPEKIKKPLAILTDTCYLQREPLGVCLVLGAWNYPIQLSLVPLIGAIAAGNCVILKPSEISHHSAMFLEKVLPRYVDSDCIKVINGGIPETTVLLTERFDYIFYTGSPSVGRIVMQAAAKHLTPVTLEMGGKSPVYIDKNIDMKIVAKRIWWGKASNCGQTCIAPDYVMCTPEIQNELIKHTKICLTEFFGENAETSDNYGRLVSDRNFQRIKGMLKSGTVALGGNFKESKKYVEPTVLINVKPSDPVMQEEIFGPILPIYPVKNEDEAIRFINSREKPLALYIFSHNKKVINKFLTQTSSGGLIVNDTLMHAGITTLPLGGVGNSGMGNYHGKYSFETFSHKKAVLLRTIGLEWMIGVRYAPFTEQKLKVVNFLISSQAAEKYIPYFLFSIFAVFLAFLWKMYF